MNAPFPWEPEARSRYFGVYSAVVKQVDDPDGLGRVAVTLPWIDEKEGEKFVLWARISTLMAGAERGSFFLPEPGDEVLLAFMGGDPRHPVVVGALWNGAARPPESASAGNDIRALTTRSGHRLCFDDGSPGKIELKSSEGHLLRMEETGKLSLVHSNGAGVEIDPSGKVTITGHSSVEIRAPQVKIDAAVTTCTGLLKAEAVTTNSVVSSVYSQGAGNVW